MTALVGLLVLVLAVELLAAGLAVVWAFLFFFAEVKSALVKAGLLS